MREKKYVSLGYGLPNFEYKIRFQRFLTKQPVSPPMIIVRDRLWN